MSAAGILFEDDEPAFDNTDDSIANEPTSALRSFSLAELETELQQAVDDEDYERASLIRDEIKKRK